MKVRDLIISARKVIEKPENWTTQYYARDADNEMCSIESANAVCFCSLGALRKVLYNNGGMDIFGRQDFLYDTAAGFLKAVAGIGDVADYNDNHTHAEVLALFDKTITDLEIVNV